MKLSQARAKTNFLWPTKYLEFNLHTSKANSRVQQSIKKNSNVSCQQKTSIYLTEVIFYYAPRLHHLLTAAVFSCILLVLHSFVA